MIRNTRPSIERELWELPAGTLDKEGESFAEAAARELEEETGYKAGKLELLCTFYSSPGFLTEVLHAYVATDLKRTRQQLEPTERIIVEEVELSAAVEMALDGRITDGKTMIALFHWELRRRSGR
jgi:ADP-ribose pyrophosphatase